MCFIILRLLDTRKDVIHRLEDTAPLFRKDEVGISSMDSLLDRDVGVLDSFLGMVPTQSLVSESELKMDWKMKTYFASR